MTRMLPPTIHSSVKSRAEKRIYEVIRDAPGTEHWVCLHSLGVAHHERKRRAEIDLRDSARTPDGASDFGAISAISRSISRMLRCLARLSTA